MYVYILVAILYIFALWKERQALGCPEGLTFKDCNNAEGKAVKGTKPDQKDPTNIVFDKMSKAADFADRWVVWRVAFLISVPCVIVSYFFLNSSIFLSTASQGADVCIKTINGLRCTLVKSMPSEKELVIGSFVITALVYFAFNFYKFHLINYAKNNIDTGINILKTRVK